MSSELDLRGLHGVHEPDPAFVERLRLRLEAASTDAIDAAERDAAERVVDVEISLAPVPEAARPGLGRIAFLVAAAILVLAAVSSVLWGQLDDSDPTTYAGGSQPFVGTWVSTDSDGSSQTMEIEPSRGGEHEVVIHDDAATAACGGAPATLTGSGRPQNGAMLVIAVELTCDDGSTPVPMSDPESARELRETLANLTFVHDPATDELTDSLGVVWRRAGADDATAPTSSGTMWPQSSPSQPTAIRAMVDAINTRDSAAFLDAFAPEGGFAPRGDFAESSSLFGHDLPVTDVELVRAWMAVMDAWGLEAEIISCGTRPVPAVGNQSEGVDEIVECEVATRWHTLSMELIEGWYFELRGEELLWWNSLSCCRNDLDLLDLDPPDRTLPLGYPDLEAWEAWLRTEHPDDAARFLNPRARPGDCDGCDHAEASLAPGDPDRAARLAPLVQNARDDWMIHGHRFSPIGLIPYDPALAAEIDASIRQYLEQR
jgi:hypothetical protein